MDECNETQRNETSFYTYAIIPIVSGILISW